MTTTTWLERWAAKGPWAAAGAFAVAAFLESLFVPFIIDALLLALVLSGAPLWRLVGVGLVASLAGTLVWYVLGAAWGGDGLTFATELFGVTDAVAAEAGRLWSEHWPKALLLTSVTAIPDPLMAAIAGASGVPMWGAVAALTLGHVARFALIGGMVWVGVRFMETAGSVWKRRVAVGALWVGVGFGLLLGGLLLAGYFQR
jgi:membrane protein YqaA with SNARE-associated domain